MYHFNSKIDIRGEFKDSFSQDIVKNETMFFNSSLKFAYQAGGQLTRAFIDNLPDDWVDCNPVFDSRVHMLMEGWYPCIGGFHHDDVPRSTASGQPNYDSPEYHSEHLMGLVNGDIAPTLFALGEHGLPKVDAGIINKVWNPIVEQQLKDNILQPYAAPSGKYIQFDCRSIHRGQAANANGWRWFVRLTRNTVRQKSMTNEIRRQVQVYLDPTVGW